MSGKVTRSTADKPSSAEKPGLMYRIGWWCFLALVALTPVVLGTVPPQFASLYALRAWDPAGIPKLVTILVLGGVSLSALCVSVLLGEVKLRWHRWLWLVVAFVGWAGVSAVASDTPGLAVWGNQHSNEGLAAIVGFALVAFLAVQYIRTTHALRTLAVAVVASGAAVSVYALMQAAGVEPFGWVDETGRVFSTMGNADFLGTYLLLPLGLALGLALSTPRGRTAFAFWAASGLVAGALIATLTRGAWIGALALVLAIRLVGWGAEWKAGRGTKRAAAGAALLAVISAGVAIVMIRPRMAGSESTLAALLEKISNGRTVIWATGLRGWAARPVTGWGPDRFSDAFQSAVGANWYALVNGLYAVENAHNFLVQTLVTLGIPGLALLLAVLAYAGVVSLKRIRRATGSGRMLLVAVWGALAGTVVALIFGVTIPAVTVWLWLLAGALIAPAARAVTAPKTALIALSALGVALAVLGSSWLVADMTAGSAMQLPAGDPRQVAQLEKASRINPLSSSYPWMVADALVNQALAERNAGMAQQAEATMLRVMTAYDAALEANRGDALVRAAYANYLVAYAAGHPGTNAAARAVEVASAAVERAPGNPAALGALARAYDVSGRSAEANEVARRARQIAPEYAAQTLGTLGL